MLEATIIIICLIFLALIWVIYNLNRKNEKLDIILDNQDQTIDKINEFITEADLILKSNKMYGAFFSDDEVGGYFQSIQNIQEELNKFKIATNNWNHNMKKVK